MPSTDPASRRSPLAPAELIVVENLCDRYEEACQAGVARDLAGVLAEAPENLRPALFRELLLIDLAYRVPANRERARQEYLARFPDYAVMIEEGTRLAVPLRLCPNCHTPLPRGAGGQLTCPRCGAVNSETGPWSEGDRRIAPSGRGASEFSFLSPPASPDELGWLGPYRILGVIGRGGMGLVFRAEDPTLHRQIALKVILPGRAGPGDATRFLREARAAAAIEHDHIIPIFHVGEHGQTPYLAMPLLKGQTLADVLRHQELASTRYKTAEVIRIGREIAEGLAAAHTRGLVHRDIKPANIWLEDPNRRVRILDFGLVRSAGLEGRAILEAEATDELTRTGSIVGTPAYMSPEQVQGGRIDERSDLYSLGVVLYRMVTGRLPFTGKTSSELFHSILNDTPQPPPLTISSWMAPPTYLMLRLTRGWLPEWWPFAQGFKLNTLILRLLAKDPGARPASAEDVVRSFRSGWLSETWGEDLGRSMEQIGKVIGGCLAALVFTVMLIVRAIRWGASNEFGTLDFESGDANARAIVNDRKPAVLIKSKEGKTYLHEVLHGPIKLEPGEYRIDLADPKDGITLARSTVEITKGKEEEDSNPGSAGSTSGWQTMRRRRRRR